MYILSSIDSDEYIPEIERITAVYLPAAFSTAIDISPNVALFFAASTDNSSKLALPELHDAVIVSSALITSASSLFSLSSLSLLICDFLTEALSTSRISMGSSLSSLYLLIPTITSFPASILACFLAAASSIRILGIPVSIALVIPPSSSTSSISFHAFCASSSVRFST